jgi:sterol desaturase/sphingolipid hydroxylase (fatty acid hydroxylase superfamily)
MFPALSAAKTWLMVAVRARTEIDMLQVSATDGKKWRPGIPSLTAIGVIVMLFASYLASQFTQRVEAGYLDRTMSAWVNRNAAISHISSVYEALLRIPAIQAVLNPTVAVISALLAIELLLTGWRKSALNRLLFRRNFSANRDLTFALVVGFGYLGAFATAYSLGGYKLTGIISNLVIAKLSPFAFRLHSGSVILDILIYLLVVSFFDYWGHRILHTKAFWPLHRFHHSATEFNTLTVYRNHPAVAAWEPLVQMWPVALLPMTPSISAYWPLVVLLWHTLQMVNHTDFDWTYGWVGRWLLMSPGLHKIHHSNNPAHFNKNLGNLFMIWDRIFGTYHAVSPQPIILGLLGEDGKLSERWIGVEWALDIRHLLTGKYALERRRAASSRQHPGMGRRLDGRPEGYDVRLGGKIDETGNAGGVGEF